MSDIHFLVQSLFLFLLVCADVTYSKVHYIRPTLNSPCPQNVSFCLTLSQFAANSNHSETDVSLLFFPGNHTLDQGLYLAQGHNFSMSKYAEDNEKIFVECTNQWGRFDISEATYASINNLHFVGCGSNRVSQVQLLTITDSTFQHVVNQRTVLKINKVVTANIIHSHFLYNKLEYSEFSSLDFDYVTLVPFLERNTSFILNTLSTVVQITVSNISFMGSTFSHNRADIGILVAYSMSLHIDRSAYKYNDATLSGAMFIYESLIDIDHTCFTKNSAKHSGGVLLTHKCSLMIRSSTFTRNVAYKYYGGVIAAFNSTYIISNSNFTSNCAEYGGAIAATGKSSLNISNSNFTSNNASYGGVIATVEDYILISKSIFKKNNAAIFGGVMYSAKGTLTLENSYFCSNAVNHCGGGLILMIQCSTYIANSTFDHNAGSIYTYNGNLTFSSNSSFSKFTDILIAEQKTTSQEGGVITSFQSTVIFEQESTTSFTYNQAKDGGAILTTESTIIIYGELTIANNDIMTEVFNSSGGGISLKQTRLEIQGKCTIFNNSAVRGGGIHATSSTISVYQVESLQIMNNSAEYGGGVYFEINSKLYVLKGEVRLSNYSTRYIRFIGNYANYGGAVYVADDSNSGTCSSDNECFIQVLALYQQYIDQIITQEIICNVHFIDNIAIEQGSNLFGGLLDRCIPSPFAEVYRNRTRLHYTGVTYLLNISNTPVNSINSKPVRTCFCNREHEPDCSYRLPTITVKKGGVFSVSIVAIDQVNNTVNANITSVLSSHYGGFGEGQQTQSVGKNCTHITYTIFTPHDSETINLFADGPCENAALSTSHITIQFTDCICPVGFEPLRNSSTRCECVCDSKLSPFITDCDDATGSVFRVGTNSWITYINDTGASGYVKYPNCPFDYCLPLNKNVSINFNLPSGSDTQCAYNRMGVLCGSCRESSSLSLASSQCLPCHSHWPAVFAVILLASTLAGALLVITLLALNMTVSVGLINGFIFYANIVSAGNVAFYPSSKPSFYSIFVAWLNLDIGIDVCFIDGLDAYSKTWLQIAFPLYIIILVVMVIIVSEYSPKFTALIGRKDPVSALATLILLSYAKLLSVTIAALSFAELNYPDGLKIVWRPDGNVKYFEGKHIPLVLVALLIILIGLPYTILLFLWQWIVRAPKWKIFKLTRNTKLNAFFATYHAPHNSKHRYWTGLLLLVRVVLYVTASVTASANPQTYPLLSIIIIGCLFLLKGLFSPRVYKKSFVDVVDTALYINLLLLSAFSLYHFKSDPPKQSDVAYTSTIITLILFIVTICYHIRLLINRKRLPRDLNDSPFALVQHAQAEVTSSVIELPKPDQDTPLDRDRDELEIFDFRNLTSPYNKH